LALFRSIAHAYMLGEQHVALLTDACLLRERAEQARKQIDRDGIVITDEKNRPIQNPACVVERQSLALSARLLKQIDLPEEQ